MNSTKTINMKTLQIYVIVAIFFISGLSFGQEVKNPGEKVRSLKIAYITQELELTAKEAEKFWPVYNEYDRKIRGLERNERMKVRTIIKESNGYKNLTDNQADEILNRIYKIERQIFDTKKEMDQKLSKVISKKKILRLKHIEREFVRNLMNRLRSRKKRMGNMH
ncbi:MAG: sensor of ECF-type sigma factor [Polaribacter sp.]